MEVVSAHLISCKLRLRLWLESSLIAIGWDASKLWLWLESCLRRSKALSGVHSSNLLIDVDGHVHARKHVSLTWVLTSEAWNAAHGLEAILSWHLLLLSHLAIAHRSLSLHATHSLTIDCLTAIALVHTSSSHIYAHALTILLGWCSNCAESIKG